MSPRLITQLVEESPTLLLIGDETSLRRKIEAFLSRQGLSVTLLNGLTKQEELSVLLAKNFYKIVVIGSGETLKKTLLPLKKHANVVVINLVYSLGENQYISTQSDLIIGVDVIPEQGPWPLFTAITKQVNQGVLLDPNTTSFLQSEDRFIHLIKQHLLSPKKKRIVIKGKAHASEIILNEIVRLLSLFKPEKEWIVKEDLAPALHHDFSGFDEIKGEIEPLPSLLDESVKKISIQPQISPQLVKPDYHHRTLQQPELQPTQPINRRQSTSEESQTTRPLHYGEQENQIDQLPTHSSVVHDQIIENTPKKESAPVLESSILKKTASTENQGSKNTPTPDNSIDSSTVDEKLHQIFKVKRVDEKVERVKKIVKETKKIKKTTKKRKVLFGLGVFFTCIATSMIGLYGVFLLSTYRLEGQLTDTFLNFSVAQVDAQETDYQSIKASADFLERQINLYEQVVPPEVFISSRNLVEIASKINEYDVQQADFSAAIENLTMAFLGKDMFEDVLSSQKPSQTAQAYYETTTRLLSRLNDYSESITQQDKKEKITEFITYLEKQKNALRTYQQISPVLDMLIGKDGKKTYAVVFQNNQELRPTGGFIQAVALITVDQGMLVDSQVFSSYELDKNLGGAVVPPDDVIRLLGENKWYLRDSNWDPDFTVSGRQISWFLEQETNKKIDGVIGINLFVIQDLLKEMGPLDLDEYNEVITDKNIFERSEFHSEIKLVDSSEVEDYQVNLFRYLLRDIMNRGIDNPEGLLSAIAQSLEEKQISIYMENKDLLKTFSGLGWSGEIIVPQCPSQLSALPCHIDTLVVNEANIGINKANYHTTREDEHSISLKENEAKHTRLITLKNTAFTNAWPKGSYKAYFRFYLPANITSLSITVDDQVIEKDNYEIKKEDGYNVVGILIETPIKTDKKVELNYVVPIEFSLPYSYVFFNQKQPGTDGVLPKVTITHDASLSPTLIAPQAEVQGDTILFTDLGKDHTFVGVSFE